MKTDESTQDKIEHFSEIVEEMQEGEKFWREALYQGKGPRAIVVKRNASGGFRVTQAWQTEEAFGDDPGSWACGCNLQGKPHRHLGVDVETARKAVEIAFRPDEQKSWPLQDAPTTDLIIGGVRIRKGEHVMVVHPRNLELFLLQGYERDGG